MSQLTQLQSDKIKLDSTSQNYREEISHLKRMLEGKNELISNLQTPKTHPKQPSRSLHEEIKSLSLKVSSLELANEKLREELLSKDQEVYRLKS